MVLQMQEGNEIIEDLRISVDVNDSGMSGKTEYSQSLKSWFIHLAVR